jgi:hypothetical protein
MRNRQGGERARSPAFALGDFFSPPLANKPLIILESGKQIEIF